MKILRTMRVTRTIFSTKRIKRTKIKAHHHNKQLAAKAWCPGNAAVHRKKPNSNKKNYRSVLGLQQSKTKRNTRKVMIQMKIKMVLVAVTRTKQTQQKNYNRLETGRASVISKNMSR